MSVLCLCVCVCVSTCTELPKASREWKWRQININDGEKWLSFRGKQVQYLSQIGEHPSQPDFNLRCLGSLLLIVTEWERERGNRAVRVKGSVSEHCSTVKEQCGTSKWKKSKRLMRRLRRLGVVYVLCSYHERRLMATNTYIVQIYNT